VAVSAAAHGRQKGDFVAGAQGRIPWSEFLVSRSDYRGAVFCQLRMARSVKSKKLLDSCRVGRLDGILDLTCKLFETAEE
jgi:hypothetical protein